MTGRAARLAGAVAAIVLLAFAAHRHQLGIGLVGHDTLPLVLTARVHSFADLLETFTSEFMEDRFRLDYYRPMLNLSAAADEACFGLAPSGYQVHSIALFAAASAALFWLARRALGGRSLGPLVAALFFVLHPSHVDVLPIVARRHETLAALFAALALAVHLSPRALALRRPLVLPAFLALCAMGSKETALAFPALAFVAVLVFSPRGSGRLVHAAVATAGSWLALAVALAARFLVLGGMGGPPDRGIALHPDVALETITSLVLPQGPMRTGLGVALAVAVVAAVCFAAFGQRGGEEPRAQRRGAALLGLVWMVGTAAIHSLGGTHQPWYELLPLAGLAIVLAAVVDALSGALRAGAAPVRCWAALGLLAILLGWQVRYSPLVHPYPEWEKADRLLVRFFERVHPLLEVAEPGSVVRTPSVPVRLVDDRPGARVTDASILTQRSFQAWTELVWPDREFRVVRPDEEVEPAAGEVVVVFRRLKNVRAEDVRDTDGS